MRRSAITRARASKETMLRLVLGPDRIPFVDLLGRAPGRGTYVEADRAVFEEALSKKGLGRLFKGQAAELSAEAIAELIAGTAARLEERIVELCGLARRAGKLEIGMEATKRLAAEGREGTVIVAAKDISARSEGELPSAEPSVAVVRAGTKVTLGKQLGREDVGVVGISPSVLSERIRIEGARLSALVMPPSTNPVERGRVRRRPEGADRRRSEDQD
jgi:hypothetical protein